MLDEEDKENDDQTVPDNALKGPSKPEVPVQPASATLSRPQTQADLSKPEAPSAPASQDEVSTDSCDQDYYLPDDNTPVVDIVSPFVWMS